MEKMRRARINDSLNELKTLVLEAMKKDVSFSKFEQFKEVQERLHGTFVLLVEFWNVS